MRLKRMKHICADSDTSVNTVRQYLASGLITDAERDSNGSWLFGDKAADQIKTVKAASIARRFLQISQAKVA